jgi:hypothetical protein
MLPRINIFLKRSCECWYSISALDVLLIGYLMENHILGNLRRVFVHLMRLTLILDHCILIVRSRKGHSLYCVSDCT